MYPTIIIHKANKMVMIRKLVIRYIQSFEDSMAPYHVASGMEYWNWVSLAPRLDWNVVYQ